MLNEDALASCVAAGLWIGFAIAIAFITTQELFGVLGNFASRIIDMIRDRYWPEAEPFVCPRCDFENRLRKVEKLAGIDPDEEQIKLVA